MAMQFAQFQWQEFQSPSGVPYFYNPITRQTTWTRPPQLGGTIQPVAWEQVGNTEWQRVFTNNNNQAYYYNPSTQQSLWVLPPQLAHLHNIPGIPIPAPAANSEQKQQQQQQTQQQQQNTAVDSEKSPEQSEQPTNKNDDSPRSEQPHETHQQQQQHEQHHEQLSQHSKSQPNNEHHIQSPSPEHHSTPPQSHTPPHSPLSTLLSIPTQEQTTEQVNSSIAQSHSDTSSNNTPSLETATVPHEEGEVTNTEQKQEGPSHEEKVELFKDLLREKVKPFAKWEKEVPKLHFDARFTLIPVNERKQVFEHFVRHYAEECRLKRKIDKASHRERFRQLLEESRLKDTSTFDLFKRRHQKDERFTAIDVKECRQLFDDFIAPLKKERELKLQKLKDDFFELLQNHRVSAKLTWFEVKGQISGDERYHALDSALREEVFNKYCERHKEEEAKERIRLSEIAKKREEEEALRRAREAENKKRMESSQAELLKWTVGKAKDSKPLSAVMCDVLTSYQMPLETVVSAMKRDKRFDALVVTEDLLTSVYNSLRDAMKKTVKDEIQAIFTRDKIPLDTNWHTFKEAHLASLTGVDKLGIAQTEIVFGEVIEELIEIAKEKLKEWMAEVELVTDLDNLTHDEFKDLLRSDERYQALACRRSERDKVISRFLEKSQTNSRNSRTHKRNRKDGE
eukprot:c8973_g1_i1.p1 GENE.c8973_g1_i1~~c8973_g1_i1.p1  ORF type:complete len:758 (-),score=197.50 c8973_g1_i1:119-2158(-)